MAVSKELEQRINANWESLPKDVRVNNDPAIAFDKSYDLDQQDIATQKFLLDAYGKTMDDFDECLSVLTRIFGELGLKESVNPFINFLKLDGGKFQNIMNQKNLIILNNLYSDKFIDNLDLEGRSVEGKKHPIFQQNFYEVEDPEFTLEAYDYFSSLNNIKKLNFGTFANYPKIGKDDALKILGRFVSDETTQNGRKFYVTNPEKVKKLDGNDIEFCRGALINGGSGHDVRLDRFRPTAELKQLIDLGGKKSEQDRSVGAKGGTKKISSDIAKEINDLDKNEVIELLKGIITSSNIDINDLR